MTGKQTAEQSVKNNQQSVQSLISYKMSKQLMQFFANKSDKISDSFKIKLEDLTFDRLKSELLSNQSEVNSENKNEISNEIEKVLKIIKKQVKSSVKKSVKSCKNSASNSSSSNSSSSFDESDH